MWKAIKQVVIGLLSSKKAVMGISAAVAAGVMKLGYNIESETVALIVGPVVAAIVGQAAADYGKEAAKVTTGSTP